jgi:hypothetical protein
VAEQCHQSVKVEPGAEPVVVLRDAVKAARQKLVHSEEPFHHRKRTLAGTLTRFVNRLCGDR